MRRTAVGYLNQQGRRGIYRVHVGGRHYPRQDRGDKHREEELLCCTMIAGTL